MAQIQRRAELLAVLLFVTAITPMISAKGPASEPSIPAGTQVNVRLKDKLSSSASKPGDQFRGRLETPITADGRVLYPKGTEVTGYVVRSRPSGPTAGPGVLELDLLGIGAAAKMTSVTARTLVLKGAFYKKSKVPSAVTPDPGVKERQESVVEFDAILTWIAVQPGSLQDWSKSAPGDVRRGAGTPFRIIRQDQQSAKPNASDSPKYGFNDRDRRVLSRCFAGTRGGVSPSLSSKEKLPPGAERQFRKDNILPAGLEKRLAPLPSSCSQQLSPVPRKWARVVVSGRVLLLDPSARIADVFVF